MRASKKSKKAAMHLSKCDGKKQAQRRGTSAAVRAGRCSVAKRALSQAEENKIAACLRKTPPPTIPEVLAALEKAGISVSYGTVRDRALRMGITPTRGESPGRSVGAKDIEKRALHIDSKRGQIEQLLAEQNGKEDLAAIAQALGITVKGVRYHVAQIRGTDGNK